MAVLRACLAALVGVMLGMNVLAQNGGSSTMLDTLFAKLQTATDPTAIQTLEAAIWEQWVMVPDTEQRGFDDARHRRDAAARTQGIRRDLHQAD